MSRPLKEIEQDLKRLKRQILQATVGAFLGILFAAAILVAVLFLMDS